MTKTRSTRKRNAPLPRTSHAKREYMQYKAKQLGYAKYIDYIEDKAAPQRAVNAYVKAKEQQHDEDINSNH